MKYLGIPKLTSEQAERLCIIAEQTSRDYVQSRVSKKCIERLDISAYAEGAKPMSLTIEVHIELSLPIKDFETQKLADEAVQEGFGAAEKYLRELNCQLQT